MNCFTCLVLIFFTLSIVFGLKSSSSMGFFVVLRFTVLIALEFVNVIVVFVVVFIVLFVDVLVLIVLGTYLGAI